ncbi:hypothetical protein CHU98_g255 [Xylaria longipes]|nr:hypothetical protein CHU98_g255 [Xylaria longipes]
MPHIDYVLYESATGYALFKVVHQQDDIALRMDEVKKAAEDLSKLGKMLSLTSYAVWRSAAEALENIHSISEGLMTDYLKSTIELNIPASKKSKVVLGVADKNLAGNIKDAFAGISVETSDTSEAVAYLLRGIRLHASKLFKDLKEGDEEKAQLGLGHAYSRSKVKFNVHRNDNHIIRSIATLDNLDKGINLFSQKLREWYSWHFPELYAICSDNLTYAKVARFVGDKSTLGDDKLHELAGLVGDDEEKAAEIIQKAKMSMGRELSEVDLENVLTFAEKVQSLAVGDVVAARLIQKAGSLTNLSKYPASTLQILGAEKALFRALKTKSNTPKYGLIFHSSFIGRAAQKDKGRVSRYLANKCSIAARIDNFSEQPSKKFGEVLRGQVEDRLEFYATGKKPTKNADAMDKAVADLLAEGESMAIDTEMIDAPISTTAPTPKKEKKSKDKKDKEEKKEKKDKKRRHSEVKDTVDADAEVDGEKKKKKKKRHSEA